MRSVIIDINPGMAIIGELPNGDLGAAYSYQLTGIGGQGGYTFSTTGLSGTEFSLASDGTITSTGPTVPGNIDFAVTMRDMLGRKVVREFTLRVIALPLTVAGTLDAFTYGSSYSDTLTISGGVPPYTVTPLAKPSWLSITESGGTITISAATVGSYTGSTVDIRVTDSDGASVDLAYPFAWTTLALTGTFADGSIGTAYSSDLTISGGNGNYSLTGGDGVIVGSLPAGLSLSIVAPDKLRLSGTPTAYFSGQFEASVDSGDGQSATSVQSPEMFADPYWSNVVSLLHFNGTDGSTTFTDETGKTWVAHGNAQIDTSVSKFGGSSLLLDGSGDYLEHSALLPASTDFTLEAFVLTNNSKPYSCIASQYQVAPTVGRFIFGIHNGKLYVFVGGGIGENSAGPSIIGQMTHVSVCRSGNDWYMSYNGTVASLGSSSVGPLQTDFLIGFDPINTGRDWDGHIDELRITSGVARYTSNFTPPTLPFPNG